MRTVADVRSDQRLARQDYETNGFCAIEGILSPDEVQKTALHAEAVVEGAYETDEPPKMRTTLPGDRSGALVKIDQPHYSNPSLLEAIAHPAVGEWAAAVTGASYVQVWAVNLLYKPPGGAPRSNVGWHQDDGYWKEWIQGETFTMWLALSDVTEASGPLRFVVGSHTWGGVGAGDFFSDDMTPAQGGEIPVPDKADWQEATALVPAGGASMHSRFTFHGSGPNSSPSPRIGLALHLRSENSSIGTDPPPEYPGVLDDPQRCPVVYNELKTGHNNGPRSPGTRLSRWRSARRRSA
jgi:ectoine hydroxylase-related dioxygenase (phytanoyl-CoA dioxygenase family)